jgi:hypothetical protein
MRKNQTKYAWMLKLFAVIVFFSSADYTIATNRTWTGSTNSDWNIGSNWGGSVPDAGDKAIIPTGLATYPIITNGTVAIKEIKVTGTGSLTIKGGILNISSKLEFHSSASPYGFVMQSGGTMTVKDLIFEGAGSFTQNEDDGVSLLKISRNYINSSGGTFNSTAGTVQLTGSGNNKADYSTGTNQFFNIIIDVWVDPKFDNAGGGVISVAGNFTNNNSGLDATNSTFTFNGSGDQTIYSASTPIFGDLVVSKSSGTLQLISDLAVDDTYTDPSSILDDNGFEFWVAGNPMPVELASFSAVILDEEVKLSWRTITEVNNYGFDILRRTREDEWVTIGFVEGHGNTNSPKDYEFNDASVNFVGTCCYRLKQIDNDGSYEYSKQIKVDFESPNNFELRPNYPNPFNPSTTISFSLPVSDNATLKVFNALGEEIITLVESFLEAGIHTYIFNAEYLTSGIYVYKLSTAEATQTRKMLYLK